MALSRWICRRRLEREKDKREILSEQAKQEAESYRCGNGN